MPTFFEVTHLVNSLLGLVVVPREHLINHLPNTAIAHLGADWPRPRLVGTEPGPTDLRQLVIAMRNAVGHFNVEFVSDGEEVTGVRFRTRGSRTVEFGIDDLRGFVDCLAAEIELALSRPATNHRAARGC